MPLRWRQLAQPAASCERPPSPSCAASVARHPHRRRPRRPPMTRATTRWVGSRRRRPSRKMPPTRRWRRCAITHGPRVACYAGVARGQNHCARLLHPEMLLHRFLGLVKVSDQQELFLASSRGFSMPRWRRSRFSSRSRTSAHGCKTSQPDGMARLCPQQRGPREEI